MKTISDYLDDAKEITGSDYKTAQALGITRQYVSTWRRGGPMSDDICYQLAELLKISPFEIIANQNAQRAKDKEMRKKWEKLARSVAALLVLFVGMASPSEDAQAAAAKGGLQLNNNIHYAHIWVCVNLPGSLVPCGL